MAERGWVNTYLLLYAISKPCLVFLFGASYIWLCDRTELNLVNNDIIFEVCFI